MKQIELVLQNPTGLHARPAKVLVNLAKQFKAEIGLHHGAKRANAKSMVSVLTLGAVKGSCITIQVNGEDEDHAIAELEAAFLSGLGDTETPVEPQPAASAVPVTARAEPSAIPAQTVQAHAPGVIKGVGAAPGIAVGPISTFNKWNWTSKPLKRLPAPAG